MDYGELTTGTRDEHYNLVSVLYHALQGAENCDTYALDAEAAGNERLAGFFREAQVMQSQIAERAKGLLGIPESPPEFGVTPGDMAGGIPPEEVAPPDAPSHPREEPPPGEERPERRGEIPTSPPTPREDPPPGEERPPR